MTHSDYDLKSVKMPRLAGSPLRIFIKLLENKLTCGLLSPKLLRDFGLFNMRKLLLNECPSYYPHWNKPDSTPEALNLKKWLESNQPAKNKGFNFATTRDYAAAYQSGTITPETVAEKALEAIKESESGTPALRAFIACSDDNVMAQAKASAERWRKGKPLSIFDGVPVAVKDEVDMVPYATTMGTAHLGKTPVKEDSTVVARMRAGGALLLGKANMNEMGIGVTGLNLHHGVTRNPYNPDHFTGGSSSGSATAVAAGFCPAAISADGGGSIRLPAALCGLFGLKPTFGRVSEHNSKALCWSVAHIGPIAATAEDAALMYAQIAGKDPNDRYTLHQPPVSLEGFNNFKLKDLKIGIYRPWFEHASAEIVKACENMVKALRDMGASLTEIEIPELEPTRIALNVTIGSEMLTAVYRDYAENPALFGPDVRINFAMINQFTAADYLRAQQIRSRTMAHFKQAFEKADVIITPATGLPAPAIPKDALLYGESDLTTLTELMRFSIAANVTGLPAISFPAGYTKDGLPIGCQLIGRAWEEDVLLRLAHAAEQVVKRKKPLVHYRFLPK